MIRKLMSDGDEGAIGQHRALLLRAAVRLVAVTLAESAKEVVVEVQAAGEAPMIGMMMSSTMRTDDLAEGGADDDTDCKIKGIALEGEGLEFLPHRT